MTEIDNTPTVLFQLNEFNDGDAKGFSVGQGAERKEYFAIRKNDAFFVYENSCPHTGVGLDWVPNQFLNMDRTFIQCANHDALFEIENGLCISGPCVGQYLKKLNVEVRDGAVMLL